MSQSEKTALTLAFLGAVAGLAPQYRSLLTRPTMADMGNIRLVPGVAYPVVLDAPYSPFDDTYAATVTQAITDLATQVVVTSSKNKVRHLEAIEGKVGKSYVFHMTTSSNRAPGKVFSDETVTWHGRQVPYVTVDEGTTDAVTRIEAI